MTLTDQLLAVADAYCAARDLSAARVSTLVFNDGKKLDLLRSGKDLSTRNHERAMCWFSTNWPAKTPWPRTIRRPATTAPERVAS